MNTKNEESTHISTTYHPLAESSSLSSLSSLHPFKTTQIIRKKTGFQDKKQNENMYQMEMKTLGMIQYLNSESFDIRLASKPVIYFCAACTFSVPEKITRYTKRDSEKQPTTCIFFNV